ncbi:cornifelin homolog [Pelodytes ibericus]
MQPMNTVSVQPMAVTQTVMVTQGGEWASGICDCCDDCGICCLAFWCFPCFQCKTSDDFGECLCLPLLENGALPIGCLGCGGYSPCVSLSMRAAARERYRIRGSICNDCCMVYWCNQCSWCQIAREIKKRKQPFTMVSAQTTTMGMPVQNPQYTQYNYTSAP